jgi:hypothetical protein
MIFLGLISISSHFEEDAILGHQFLVRPGLDYMSSIHYVDPVCAFHALTVRRCNDRYSILAERLNVRLDPLRQFGTTYERKRFVK